MSRNPSQYAKNIARLSARIFGEQLPSTKGKSRNIQKVLGTQPFYKNRFFTHYYPPVQDVRDFFAKLRHLGLFVDEHQDFKEEMTRLRNLRGKGFRKGKKE